MKVFFTVVAILFSLMGKSAMGKVDLKKGLKEAEKLSSKIQSAQIKAYCNTTIETAQYLDLGAVEVCRDYSPEEFYISDCLSAIKNKVYTRAGLTECTDIRNVFFRNACLAKGGRKFSDEEPIDIDRAFINESLKKPCFTSMRTSWAKQLP